MAEGTSRETEDVGEEQRQYDYRADGANMLCRFKPLETDYAGGLYRWGGYRDNPPSDT